MGCLNRVDPFGSQGSLASENLEMQTTVCDSDPVTATGRKTMMTMMLTVPSLTLILIGVQTAVYMVSSVIVLTDVQNAVSDIDDIWGINDLTERLQDERDILVDYVGDINNVTEAGLQSIFRKTDAALNAANLWPGAMDNMNTTAPTTLGFKRELSLARQHFLNSSEDSVNTMVAVARFYHDVIMEFVRGISLFTHGLKTNQEGFISYLIAYYSVEMAVEYNYMKRFLGTHTINADGMMRSGALDDFVFVTYVGDACLNDTLFHSTKATEIYTSYLKDQENPYEAVMELQALILHTGHTGIPEYPEVLTNWSRVMTAYIEVLIDITHAIELAEASAIDDEETESFVKAICLAIFTGFIIFGTPGLLWWVRKITRRVHKIATSLNDTNMMLRREKKKGDVLLYQLLPKSVALQLKMNKKVSAESYNAVTIFFSDICGFTAISSRSTPMEVVGFLNKLYQLFDGVIEKYDVYKVETIGDAYMVASGCPLRNGNRHVGEISSMSLVLMDGMRRFKAPHLPEEVIRMRVGLHTGSVVAGVVGTKMPRYCLFGDTVTIASVMESGGVPMQIQISDATRIALDEFGGYVHELRGQLTVKIANKGVDMTTHFLMGRISGHTDSRASTTQPG